jgi:hypothetical protein
MSERRDSEAAMPRAVFVRRKYLRDMRNAAHRLYLDQIQKKLFPPTNPEAAQRRAFVFSLFNIFMAEATEAAGLEAFKRAYPKALLPFRGLAVSAPPEGEDSLQSTQLHGYTLAINCSRDKNNY